jgi:hypothetical protein
MLLRFTAPDLLNTSLIDVATGKCAYDISTFLVEETDQPTKDSESPQWTACGSFAQTSCGPQMSPRSSETAASSSPAFVEHSHPEEPEEPMKFQSRKTKVTDAAGAVVADIHWRGRHPTITICNEKVGALAALFGSTSVPFQ